jgi:hypothetical protein
MLVLYPCRVLEGVYAEAREDLRRVSRMQPGEARRWAHEHHPLNLLSLQYFCADTLVCTPNV